MHSSIPISWSAQSQYSCYPYYQFQTYQYSYKYTLIDSISYYQTLPTLQPSVHFYSHPISSSSPNIIYPIITIQLHILILSCQINNQTSLLAHILTLYSIFTIYDQISKTYLFQIACPITKSQLNPIKHAL